MAGAGSREVKVSLGAFGDYPWQHVFFLQIVGDHGRIVEGCLPKEATTELASAREIITAADSLLALARTGRLAKGGSLTLVNMSIDLKRKLLAGIYLGTMIPKIKPSTLTQYINEEMRYATLITLQASDKPMVLDIAEHTKLWIKDAIIHLCDFRNDLDDSEKTKKMKLLETEMKLIAVHLKAHELHKVTKHTGLTDFPALRQLGTDSINAVQEFNECVREMQTAKMHGTITTISDLLEYDHILREMGYFLEGIAFRWNIPTPSTYDPIGERAEGKAAK